MKAAYGVLGIAFVIVFGLTYVLLTREAEAPTREEASLEDNDTVTMLTLTSPSFTNTEPMQEKHSCDADNISPELLIGGVPKDTASLVLLMDDPDIPEVFKEGRGIEKFDHWVAYNIPADTTVIEEGVSSSTGGMQFGANGRGAAAYTGPCPPTEYEPTEHRYFFRLYALDTKLTFEGIPTFDEVRAALEGHILEEVELMGTYDRAGSNSKG